MLSVTVIVILPDSLGTTLGRESTMSAAAVAAAAGDGDTSTCGDAVFGWVLE